MSYRSLRIILPTTSIITFVVSTIEIAFILIIPSDKIIEGGTTIEQKRNVFIRETLLITSFVTLLISILLVVLYLIFNRKNPLELPIKQDNSVDNLFFISLALILISPIFIIILMYAFTIVMNLFFY